MGWIRGRVELRLRTQIRTARFGFESYFKMPTGCDSNRFESIRFDSIRIRLEWIRFGYRLEGKSILDYDSIRKDSIRCDAILNIDSIRFDSIRNSHSLRFDSIRFKPMSIRFGSTDARRRIRGGVERSGELDASNRRMMDDSWN